LFLKTDGAGNLSFSSDLPTTSFTGATVETSIADADLVLIYDDSATAVRKMTKANLVAGIGGANTPAFFAYQSSTQSVSSGISTKIQFQTEDLDSNNNFDSTTNYRFTPTVAGYYLLTACVRCDSGNAEHFLTIFKNNANNRNLFDLQATNVYAMNGSALVYANGSSDYFEVFFFQNSGTSKTTASGVNQTFFSGFRIIGV